MRHTTAIALGLATALVIGGEARAAGPPAGSEDDLAVVRKAVASPSPSRVSRAEPAAAQATPGVSPAPAPPPAPPMPRAGREPQWFKVRVVDRATGNRRVTINLPLAVVRVLGDHTIDVGCHRGGEHEGCHDLRLADVLRTLESGQELVEVQDEEATVRVWVE
jgi:hypothetical protein